jgi:radical SAM superfamily enzyme YgiQ (UPF0313 family)
MDYEGVLIRPPSEANSLIFQVTLGCTDNGCIFCPAYKEKKFKIRDLGLIEKEIREASREYPGTRRIFLADGDAISVPREKLERIFELLLKNFPMLSRISLYGSIKSLEGKSVGELKALKERKLGTVYLGFETGDEEVYRFTKKYGTAEKNIETCLKVKEAGITANVTVILGLGGKRLSSQHAVNTAGILNRARPDQVAALTLMIAPNTALYGLAKRGEFQELDKFGYLRELKLLIENMEDFRCLFFSNHASNYYRLSSRFPKDKPSVLKELDEIIRNEDGGALAPESLRGL